MAIADERKRIGRKPFKIVEVDLDFCVNEMSDGYSSGVCTAVPDGNLLLQSSTLSTTWSGTATVTDNAANYNGVAVADKVDDVSAVAYQTISQSISFDSSQVCAAWMRFKRDSTPRSTRFCGLSLSFSGSTTEDYTISFDTSTGEKKIIGADGIVLNDPIDADYMIAGIYATSVDPANTVATVKIIPAFGASSAWNPSAAATGSIYAVGLQVVQGTTRVPILTDTTTAAISNTCLDACYKTRKTCKDVLSYSTTAKTYKFCENVAGIPVGLGAFPCVSKISTLPTRITPGKGLGYKASVTIEMSDFPYHDRGIDPYVITRTYTPENQGTFFGKLMARNPYYKGRTIRVLSGYIAEDGSYSAANFQAHQFVIDSMEFDHSKGRFIIKASDVLSKTSDGKAQIPEISTGTLSAALTDVDTTMTLQTNEGYDYRLDGNLLTRSEEFDHADWTKTNASVVADSGNDIWGLAVMDTLTDASGSYGYATMAVPSFIVTEKYLFSLFVEKDAVGRATRFPSLEIAFSGSTAESNKILFDTSTGDYSLSLIDTNGDGGVIDYGTHWRVWLRASSQDGSNTAGYVYVYPSAGASATWVLSAAATGSIKAYGGQLECNSSLGRYIQTTTASVALSNAVRISDEIITYTGRTASTLTGLTRGAWDSVADAHSIDDSVQQCVLYENVNAVDVVVDMEVRYSGISPSLMPFTDYYLEKTGNISAFIVNAIITKPEDVDKLIGELSEQSLFSIWWDDRAQKIKIKSIAPYTSDTAINDTANITAINIKKVDADRISRLIVYYDLRDRVNTDKEESYRHVYANVDLESEGSTKHGEPRIKVVKSRWYSSGGPVAQYASRMQKWKAETPIEATITVDAKDGALWVADPIDVTSSTMQDEFGNQLKTEMMIIEAKEEKDGTFKYLAINSPFFGRYAKIMANGSPDYSAATEAQKAAGGWIAASSSGFTDGGEAYKIS